MADRRIRKIRSQALDLALSGVDVLSTPEEVSKAYINKRKEFLYEA